MNSNEIICNYWELIIDKAAEIRDNAIFVNKIGLTILAESKGFKKDSIEYDKTYFKDRLLGKELEIALELLKNINKAHEEYHNLYYSVKNIVLEEKGYLI